MIVEGLVSGAQKPLNDQVTNLQLNSDDPSGALPLRDRQSVAAGEGSVKGIAQRQGLSLHCFNAQMRHPCTAGRTWEVNAGSAYARHTTLVLDSSLRMADELSFFRSGVRQEQLTSRLPPASLLPSGAANIALPRGAVVSYSLLRSSYCKNNPNHRDGTAPDGVSQ